MWVEGMGECIDTELPMLGYEKQYLGCWSQIGSLSIPLSINPHVGPAWFYLYAPAVYLWFEKITTDPYFYRYTGMSLFIANSWIFYFTLRSYYKPYISFYSAAAFITSPLLILGFLSDYELVNVMIFPILLTALLFSLYLKNGRVGLLLASTMALGMTLLARTECLVWLIVPFSMYLVLSRPKLIVDRLTQINKKFVVALSGVALFSIGALPVIAYNVLCPESNIFSFTVNTIFHRSLDGSSIAVWRRLIVRAAQFWNFNLLNVWPMYELRTRHYLMALVWIFCASILLVRWIRRGRASLALLMVLTTIILSILTTGLLRSEHLMMLQPAPMLVIASALSYLETQKACRKFVHSTFIVLLAGNLFIATMDWRWWNHLSPDSQTMLNQSDPILLAKYLSEHHARDRILYTNVGLPQYVKYMTVGQLKGEDIMDWTSLDGFIKAVRITLLDKNSRRVFVAVSRDHDGAGGAAPRTEALYNLLDQSNVPYAVTHLSNDRNNSLYDLIVVDEGYALEARSMTETMLVSDVVDVRVSAAPDGNPVVIGSILGRGLKSGDSISINGKLVLPTYFGNEGWITFSVPLEFVGNHNRFTLQVLRTEGWERSREFTVEIQR
jgi:hypothetical protein